jgi:hypothetical protein
VGLRVAALQHRNLKRSMIPQLNTVPGIVVLELQCPAQKISKPIL